MEELAYEEVVNNLFEKDDMLLMDITPTIEDHVSDIMMGRCPPSQLPS